MNSDKNTARGEAEQSTDSKALASMGYPSADPAPCSISVPHCRGLGGRNEGFTLRFFPISQMCYGINQSQEKGQGQGKQERLYIDRWS